jgi:tetratricopeptide (TPR) repeat protein
MLKLSMIEKNYGTLSLDQALSLGIDFQNNGKLNEAMQVYLQILESQPDHSIAMGNLGIVYSLEGKHEAAIDCLSKETAKNPTSALAFFNLGYAELGPKKIKMQPNHSESLWCLIQPMSMRTSILAMR